MAEFDFIIIGSGSAGGVLAHALSADPSRTVLLLEAGPNPRNPILNIPLAGPGLAVGNDRLDWKFTAQADPSCAQRQIDWPRGRMLGGSSRLNGMVYVRGAARDYDGWAKEGVDGWAWQDVEPHFRAIEAMQNPDDGCVLGTRGEHRLHRLNRPHTLSHAFVAAHGDLGYPPNSDCNCGDQAGASILVSSSDGLRRSSSVSGFLAKAKRRANLKVECARLVDRIECEGSRAKSVRYTSNGHSFSAAARQKIILCAGAIGSPAILMRSGIGSPGALAGLGIEARTQTRLANAHVGANLHEHPAVQLVAKSKRQTISTKNRLHHMPGHLKDWLWHRGGLLAAASYEAISFVRSAPDQPFHDLQLHFAPYGLVRGKGRLRQHPSDSFMIQANVCYPQSRGCISLASNDPRDAPVIEARMLGHKADVKALASGVKFAMQVFASKPFESHFDGCFVPNKPMATREEIKEWLPKVAVPAYHPAGTCRMGREGGAVVDSKLKVFGMDNLFVVDASVIPAPISGNIQAATMMIAHKASGWLAKN